MSGNPVESRILGLGGYVRHPESHESHQPITLQTKIFIQDIRYYVFHCPCLHDAAVH